MKHRFFHPEPTEIGTKLVIEGDEFHHAARVRRIRPGEEVEIFDGRGGNVLATVEAIDRRSMIAVVDRAIPQQRESSLPIALAIALIQPDRFEMVLQKGTELGVSRFIPLVTDRIDVPPERVKGKLDRWRKLLVEATKQCGRSIVPSLSDPVDLHGLEEPRSEPTILFDADAPTTPLPGHLDRVCLLIGPEGGWTEREIGLARELNITIQRLGPRRLRAETAAIAAVVTIGLHFGDLS